MSLVPLLLLGLTFSSQENRTFPFVIPWDDAVKGTATDVSFLNEAPAGKHGWIVARNGVLVESKTGKRRKFLATNFTTRAAFPSHADADRVAKRLAKLGINLVRFHHLQNSWDPDKGMIWKKGREMIELDPKQLDRFDYLIAALKRHGIYSNINLQTTREYLPEMGFPESVRNLPWSFAKRIDKFDRKMIALQKEYARQLIGRKNRYTGLRYTDDPAILVVEINNENSLVGAPWETLGAGFDQVPEPFRGNLRGLWNAWLAKRWSDDRALERRWSQSTQPPGPSLLGAGTSWNFEHQGATRMTSRGGASDHGLAFDVDITNNQGPNWSLQANVSGLNLKNGETYTVRFRAKADRKRHVSLQAGLDRPDWRNIGLNTRVNLDTDWVAYEYAFTVADTEPNHSRVGFVLGDAIGKVSVADFSLSQGAEPFKLPEGQSLARRNIDLPGGSGPAAQAADFMDFLTETEAAYSLEMRNFLKRELGYKGLVVDTQISWGGLTGLVREAPMEIADNHAYYHHPEFPGASWDAVNWVVRNSPMVAEMGSRRYGELGGLAQYRVAGKPYSISEYNHPAPMDDRAEMMPLLSSFAAVQDWDALYSFDYGSYGAGEPNDKIQGFFAVGSDPTKAAFFPAAALIFRHNLIPRATAVAVLELPAKPYATTKTAYGAWAQAGGIPDLFRTRIGIRRANAAKPTIVRSGKASDPLLSLNEAGGRKVYQADAPAAKLVVGQVGGRTLNLKGAEFRFGSFLGGFASVALTATDAQPIARSRRLLLTLVGRVENRNMGWNATRTSVGDKWGDGPTQAQLVPLTISVASSRPRTVYSLDGNGRRVAKVPAQFKGDKLTFSTTAGRPSLWFEIAG